MRRLQATLAAALVTFGIAACGPSSSSDESGSNESDTTSGTEVTIELQSYAPDPVTVPVGTTVTWKNSKAIRHTVTSGTFEIDPATELRTSEAPDGRFDSQVAAIGDTASYTFQEAGTSTYFCTIHKGMNGSVVVTP